MIATLLLAYNLVNMPPLADRLQAVQTTPPVTGKPLSERLGTLTGTVVNAGSTLEGRLAGLVLGPHDTRKNDDLATESITRQGAPFSGTSEISHEERAGSLERNGTTLSFKGNEVKNLAATVFAEAENLKDPEAQKTEFRHIANVILNRAVKDGSITKTLGTTDVHGRHQFQGIDNPQYKLYYKGGNSLDQKKASLVDSVIEELYKGKFDDTVDGATFFSHVKGLFTPDHSRHY